MDRPAAHAHGIDHRNAAGCDVVAIAHPARSNPSDWRAKQRAAFLDDPEQFFGACIEYLGRAADPAVGVDGNVMLRLDPGDQRCQFGGEQVGHRCFARANVETQHGEVWLDIVGAAAVDLGWINRQAIAVKRL